jgi:MFS family permease
MGTGTTTVSTKPDQRAWFLQLTSTERNTLVATFGGWALDGMDVMVYSFVIPALIAAWHMSGGQAGLLATAALLASALGGWLAGLLADRFGRARILQLTILWFAFFTFLSGFTNNFWQLLLTRGLQGLGFGGEWAVGSVLMGETIRKEFRGRAVGTVQGGWAIGWAVTALFYSTLFSWFPPAIAWRAMFWIGILPAFLVFYIRRYVPEPDVFARSRKKLADEGDKPHFLEIFSPAMLKTTCLASLVGVGIQGGYHAITLWLPTYLKTVRHLSVLNTGAYLVVVIAGSFCGYIVGAHLCDALGRKKCLILFSILCSVTVWAYTFLPISDALMLVLGFPLGAGVSGSAAPAGAFFTELFPTRLRGSGQGFAYNFGRGVGALFPTAVGFLSARVGLGKAIAIFAVAAYVVLILSASMLPETKGKQLQVSE